MIHQTFTAVHLRLLTPESSSTSLATEVQALADGRFAVAGLYRNEPGLTVRKRSPIHYGGLKLELQGEEFDRLAGHYWTDRGTQGELKLSFAARSEATDYQMASGLHDSKLST